MNSSKRPIIISYSVLAACLLGIFVFWFVHCSEVKSFNNVEHTADAKIADSESAYNVGTEDTEDASLVIYFRGGNSDSWIKESDPDGREGYDLIGSIYQMSVYNNSEYKLSDWYFRQDIMQDCYINNAWCGDVEIHQFDENGDEHVETLNLMEYTEADVSLDHIVKGSDVLISLHEGDYIIYHPALDVYEAPIDARSENRVSSSNIGFIYYFYGKDIDLSQTNLVYKYEKTIYQGDAFTIFATLLIIWVIAFFVCLTATISAIRYNKREKFISEALTVFTNFVDAKDPYTSGHSNRVAEYSEKIAKAMGMGDEECRKVYYIALLHDVGKCYIDDNILKKPSRLTSDEFEIIKSHTVKGAEMLKPLSSVPDLYNGALYHHERYDGKGYPSGKRGENIPLIGRIICVADSFDAMNSDRCYRPKLSRDVIISEIKNNSGTQFDPKIAEVFLKLINENKISCGE